MEFLLIKIFNENMVNRLDCQSVINDINLYDHW